MARIGPLIEASLSVEATLSDDTTCLPQSSLSTRTSSPPPSPPHGDTLQLNRHAPESLCNDVKGQGLGAQNSGSALHLATSSQLRSTLSTSNKWGEAAEISEKHAKLRDGAGASLLAEVVAKSAKWPTDNCSVTAANSSELEEALEPVSDTSARATEALADAATAEGDKKDKLLDGTLLSSEKRLEGSTPIEISDGVEDEDDRPLVDSLQVTRRSGQANLANETQFADSANSDPDEDVPLQELMQRRSSEEPSTASAIDKSLKWRSAPLTQTVARAFDGARTLSIKFFVPLASSAMQDRACTALRNRGAVFDAAIGVSEHGRVATFSEELISRSCRGKHEQPSKMLRFQARDLDKKVKGEKSSIDKVEDVSRLTSKVCGIASSTKKPLGLGNHQDYPCQVSLVTVNDRERANRTYYLDERPHAWGVASICHFPRTDPKDASSIDFATGGIDGIVNHWHWKARSTSAETFRLHTLHDAKPIVALEHLPSSSSVLASASIGTVIGFDLTALTLGFCWNTSDHIVHLKRTPDPRLMLGVLARRDYDQFRLFDITGRNGPISRPVISFGWLNDSLGKVRLGKGSFHPTRRALFAHGGEDGRVRVWDMRNARDPLIDERLIDGPIVETIWGSEVKGEEDEEGLLYVATSKGVASLSLLAPRSPQISEHLD